MCSLLQRIRVLTTPTPEWGPLLKRNRTGPHYSTSNIIINSNKIVITIDGSKDELVKKPVVGDAVSVTVPCENEECTEKDPALKKQMV